MNILLATNTYPPHPGEVACSVERFARVFREKGHRVLVLAPEDKDAPDNETDVLRIPAIQNFNGSDFSVRLPIPSGLFAGIDRFQPDLVHSHHPFLVGDTALRIAAHWGLPMVFTYHTRYERYAPYVPPGSRALKRFSRSLAVEYANLCHQVVAPGAGIARIIKEEGVDTPVRVVPTGVALQRLAGGDGIAFRRRYGLGAADFVLGYVGRLASEKNVMFLTAAVTAFMKKKPRTRMVMVGSGPLEVEIRRRFSRTNLQDRLILTGDLSDDDRADVYAGLDLFVFASTAETQGVALAEAMAAGVPVVALSAPGPEDIVVHRRNGYLVARRRPAAFSGAMQNYYDLEKSNRELMRQAARQTARAYDHHRCAEQMLAVYRNCRDSLREPPVAEDSLWEKTLRQIEMEWTLLTSKARAAGLGRLLARHPPLVRLEQMKRFLRRWLSRAEWSARLLKLARSEEPRDAAGLLLIQIDGLSREQFASALRSGRLPFLRRLVNREAYTVRSLYAGVPSTTPAFQGELFYGVQAAVPAFAYCHPEIGQTGMLNPQAAALIESEIKKRGGEGLLEGGSCYCDFYRGGAVDVHFSPSALGWKNLTANAHPFRVALAVLGHGTTLVRLSAAMLLEFLIAVMDVIQGGLRGEALFQELKFVPARLGVNVLLREISTAGALMDIARGQPVIHLNFMGYDEQAHRRGPDSFFAHWTLKGIDRAIGMLWSAARRSPRKNYQVWIYSDHGQERTDSYHAVHQRTVYEAVSRIFNGEDMLSSWTVRYQDSTEFGRSTLLGGRYLQRSLPRPVLQPPPPMAGSRVKVTAKGPLGHVYITDHLSRPEKEHYARRLVAEADIPLVLIAGNPGTARAFTPEGVLWLPEQAEQLFDVGLPYFSELVADVISLCHHRYAGDFVISGWRKTGTPLSFPLENGAHGGPGSRETHAVAVVPRSLPRFFREKSYLRASDLRRLALHWLRKKGTGPAPAASFPVADKRKTLRLMTYNLHGCQGMDGRVLLQRTAQLISLYAPDVVCLQEVDRNRQRSFYVDQPRKIAGYLNMAYVFHPAWEDRQTCYGNVILSHYPLRLVKSAILPGLPGRPNLEPRGAMWVAVKAPDRCYQVITTHIGLVKKEKQLQIYELLSEKWLGHSACARKTLFCGDLNLSPGSFAHTLLCEPLRDAQYARGNHRPRPTWPGQYPLRTLDYIFVTPDITVHAVEVPATALARLTSDHLPVIADVSA